jgi:Family of unknown function (DUF6300)
MTIPRTPFAGWPGDPEPEPDPDADADADITLTRTARRAVCRRCGGEGLLSATATATAGDGDGDGLIVLCPACDIDDPAAAPLILFFIVHGRVTAEAAEEFARLLRTWTDSWAPRGSGR